MKIYYGIADSAIDVTNICFEKLLNNQIITIPSDDLIRAGYFKDHLVGISKSVFIENNQQITEYNQDLRVYIDVLNNVVNIVNDADVNRKIRNIHYKLKLNYGTLNDELPEQKMSARYLIGKEKVLEIGGNIGRNSVVIASLLDDSRNLVTLESHPDIAKQLTENKNLNGLNFRIESSALSKRKLIQRGWDTIPSDVLFEGFNWVNTITLSELKTKYNIEFDTLVLDCEGAFYYILMDMPEILTNVKTIIMENDYWDISHKNYVDNILTINNFKRDYVERGGWGPCLDNFFETWKKSD